MVDIVTEHLKSCETCEWIDNNDKPFYPSSDNVKIVSKDIDDEKEIKKYLSLYHKLKPHTFKLNKGDKNDYIHFYRVNQRGMPHHKCVFVLY